MIRLFAMSISVYMSLWRYSFFYTDDLFFLLNAYYMIRYVSYYFESACALESAGWVSMTFASVTDVLATKIKLFLNYYMGIIYFLRSFLTALLILSMLNIYFQPILSSLFLVNILSIRWTSSDDRLWLAGKFSFFNINYLKYSATLWYLRPFSKNGNFPLKASRYRMMPNENTSTLELPYFSQCISGAM